MNNNLRRAGRTLFAVAIVTTSAVSAAPLSTASTVADASPAVEMPSNLPATSNGSELKPQLPQSSQPSQPSQPSLAAPEAAPVPDSSADTAVLATEEPASVVLAPTAAVNDDVELTYAELPNFHRVDDKLYRGGRPQAGGFERLKAVFDGFAECLVGFHELAPNRRKVRRQCGNTVKHLFVQHSHLVPRVLIEGAHLNPESAHAALDVVEAAICLVRVLNEDIHFGFDSVQSLV